MTKTPSKQIIHPTMTGGWKLTDLDAVEKNGFNVFSCFHCGGGSTMGYKLAGYTVLGGVEIDPKIMKVYRANHHPKHSYEMPVKEFNEIPRADIPAELFDLDILDGSPPCSSFSMAGARERKWGKEHAFREGQAVQELDSLFFDYIRTAEILQPKIVVAENVKGLIIGNAKGYVKEIFREFDKAGYEVQLFLLNGCKMGVPQRRERTFFLARRKDLNLPKIELDFNEPLITVGEALEGMTPEGKITWLTPGSTALWEKVKPGETLSKAHPKGHRFNAFKANPNAPSNTFTASGDGVAIHWKEPRRLAQNEAIRIQSFPDDYDFGALDPVYMLGMSVPPFMAQRVAHQIRVQWLEALNDG